MKRKCGVINTMTAAAAGANGSIILDATEHKGLLVFINITGLGGTTPGLQVNIMGISPQGVAYLLLASAVLTAAGLTVLRVFPGMLAVANLKADDILPDTIRIDTTISGTTPTVTATIEARLAD